MCLQAVSLRLFWCVLRPSPQDELDARTGFPFLSDDPFHLHFFTSFVTGSGLITASTDIHNVTIGLSEKSEKLSEKSEMSELVFASEIMKSHIAPPSLASSVGARIRAAARKLKWTFNRTKDIWYADDRVSIKPVELRTIEEVSGVKFGQQEVSEVDDLINRATELLGDKDQDIVRTFLIALRAMVSSSDRPRA